MTLDNDILTNLAAELAAELIACSAGRLQDLAFGDAEARALRHAWEQAFRVMLDTVAADLEANNTGALEDVMRMFVAAEGVGTGLVNLALESCELPLTLLRERLDTLEFDRQTLPVDFGVVLAALMRGLAEALVSETEQMDCPQHNLVSLGRASIIYTLLERKQETLASITETVTRLERQGGRTVYNVFIQEATGVAVGDQARVDTLPASLEQVLARAGSVMPSTRTDVDAYLPKFGPN